MKTLPAICLLATASICGAQSNLRTSNMVEVASVTNTDRLVLYKSGTNPPVVIRGSNLWNAPFLLLRTNSGPVGISNGLSCLWNSNGVATYLRSGPVGFTTNKDKLIELH